MRKAIAVAVICLAASLATAAGDTHPLNVKTGLWQMTEIITWTGLPPQYAAMMKNGQPRTYKSCVKEKDLSSNPWAGRIGRKVCLDGAEVFEHRHGGAGNVVPNGQLWNSRGTRHNSRQRLGKRHGIVLNCFDRERADYERTCDVHGQVGGGKLSGGYELNECYGDFTPITLGERWPTRPDSH